MASIEMNLNAWPVKDVLPTLLIDRTTKKNIIFATDSYAEQGAEYGAKNHITEEALKVLDIQPRVLKNAEEQVLRTRKKAEVFTPSWVCCLMNNHADEVWFKRSDVFGQLTDTVWMPIKEAVQMPKRRRWQTYVDARRLEITCGEAPYLVSRYDMGTGEIIPIENRVGMLDRKLRIVNENAESEAEWLKWAIRSLQAVYGYEYQGDNLLIARVNVLMTFVEYLQERWQRDAALKELREAAKIISWNIWQMDGLKGTIPMGALYEQYHQMSLFEMFGDEFGKQNEVAESIPSRIYDWRGQNKSVEYNAFREGRNGGMKFDFIIGNPPYQESDGGAGVSATPVYNKMIVEVKKLNPKVLDLIIPAKWYAGGKGLDKFREEMLNDPHIAMLIDYTNSNDVFPGVDVAGGICVFLRDRDYNGLCKYTNHYNGVETTSMRRLNEFSTFIRYPIAVSIVEKALSLKEGTLSEMVSSRKPFGLTTAVRPLEKGDIVLRYNGGVGPYDRSLITVGKDMIDKWKVIISYLTAEHAGQPDKNGQFRVLSTMEKIEPGKVCSETYLVAGAFDTEKEADNYLRYLKTRFVRFLINQIAVTQHVTKSTFSFVPVQDFSNVWTDDVLFKKYGLNEEEISFIQKLIKEMS